MLGKIYSLAKRLLNEFIFDESEEITEEIIRPHAFSWATDTYTQSSDVSVSSDYDLSSFSVNSPTISTATPAISYPNLSSDISLLSEKLVEEARRYPINFSGEEFY